MSTKMHNFEQNLPDDIKVHYSAILKYHQDEIDRINRIKTNYIIESTKKICDTLEQKHVYDFCRFFDKRYSVGIVRSIDTLKLGFIHYIKDICHTIKEDIIILPYFYEYNNPVYSEDYRFKNLALNYNPSDDQGISLYNNGHKGFNLYDQEKPEIKPKYRYIDNPVRCTHSIMTKETFLYYIDQVPISSIYMNMFIESIDISTCIGKLDKDFIHDGLAELCLLDNLYYCKFIHNPKSPIENIRTHNYVKILKEIYKFHEITCSKIIGV